MRWAIIGVAFLMGGCTVAFPINLPGSTQVQPAADIAIPITSPAKEACLPKVEYTREQQSAFADTVSKLPQDSIILGYLTDYHNMRAADDLCINKNK